MPLVQSLSELYQQLGFLDSPQQMLKRLDFLFHEFTAQRSINSLLPEDRLQELRKFFFERKILGLSKNQSLDDFVLLSVLKGQLGSELSILTLFRSLAQKMDVQLDFVKVHHKLLLKFLNRGESFYLNATKQGNFLTIQEWVDLWQQEAKDLRATAKKLEPQLMSEAEVLLDHANELIKWFMSKNSFQQVQKTLDFLLEKFPQQTDLLGLRALAHHQLDHLLEAKKDLERYFHFVDETKAPEAYRNLMKELN